MPVRSPQLTSMIALGACLLILISTALRAADPPAAPAPAGRPETSAVELPRFQPRDVLIASDLTSYQDMSETHSAQHVTQQKIEARCLGECPGLGAGTPLPRTPKPRRP